MNAEDYKELINIQISTLVKLHIEKRCDSKEIESFPNLAQHILKD